MRFVAVIPCHNEEATIGDIVRRVRRYVPDVVVVDNRSYDETVSRAKEAGARVAYCETLGAGATTQVGVNYALLILNADAIITLDGDGQHLPEELPFLLKPIRDCQADFVVGERQFNIKNSPWVRRMAVAFTTWLYNAGWDMKLTEAQCGYRAFTRKVAEDIRITDPKFGFSVETLIKARAKGFKLTGVPVACIYHDEGVSFAHIPVLWSLLKWRYICDRKIMLKRLGYKIFNGVTRPFLGMGFGKIPGANSIYRFVMRNTLETTDKIVRINGYQLALSINRETPIDGISRRLICDHEYEPYTTTVIKKALKPGMNAVDVGANIGYYTLLMSQKVQNGKVWAFEPEPRNIKALDGNCRLNQVRNVYIEPMAVDKAPGTVSLYVSKWESGEHSLINCRKGTEPIRVSAVSLDTFFRDIPVQFIKIDTEGNDANVIKGATQLIKRFSPVIVTEFWLDGLLKSGWTVTEYWDYLKALRLENIYLIDDFRQKTGPTNMEGIVKYSRKHGGYSANLLCSAKELDLG